MAAAGRRQGGGTLDLLHPLGVGTSTIDENVVCVEASPSVADIAHAIGIRVEIDACVYGDVDRKLDVEVSVAIPGSRSEHVVAISISTST